MNQPPLFFLSIPSKITNHKFLIYIFEASSSNVLSFVIIEKQLCALSGSFGVFAFFKPFSKETMS